MKLMIMLFINLGVGPKIILPRFLEKVGNGVFLQTKVSEVVFDGIKSTMCRYSSFSYVRPFDSVKVIVSYAFEELRFCGCDVEYKDFAKSDGFIEISKEKEMSDSRNNDDESEL